MLGARYSCSAVMIARLESRAPSKGELSLWFLESIPKPYRQLILIEGVGSERFHCSDSIGGIEAKTVAIVRQEQARGDPRRALVAIDEPMIARETIGVSGGQIGRVGFSIGGEVSRSGQSRLYGATVSHSVGAAMFGDLPIMDCMEDFQTNPAPGGHFARARSTFLSSRMMSSARLIWRSKSGLYGVRR